MYARARLFVRDHGTKILGFSQATFGAIAANAGDFFTRRELQFIMMASGILTAWRGFVNSRNADPEP